MSVSFSHSASSQPTHPPVMVIQLQQAVAVLCCNGDTVAWYFPLRYCEWRRAALFSICQNISRNNSHQAGPSPFTEQHLLSPETHKHFAQWEVFYVLHCTIVKGIHIRVLYMLKQPQRIVWNWMVMWTEVTNVAWRHQLIVQSCLRLVHEVGCVSIIFTFLTLIWWILS